MLEILLGFIAHALGDAISQVFADWQKSEEEKELGARQQADASKHASETAEATAERAAEAAEREPEDPADPFLRRS